ncbi:protein-disulfide reductase DsbD [Acinetobacter guerrae]|uniref:Protein-disulfide reductase DsbD n=1 Tax=Acinetobacter guerrae TaxID=1843371 RepID=A0A3A8EGX8_9GAMM|nr:protein-disulfide reductase DsbD [Acinetobacter guerrae]RKG34197.1 protein-disulfide reductase DsbD [Acinetobacter guerrae]
MTHFQSRSGIFYFLILSLCCFATQLYAKNEALLSPEDAFSFSVQSLDQKNAVLNWSIQPNYYLYQHKFEVKQAGHGLPLDLPKAVQQYDDNFGQSQVYYQNVQFKIHTQPSQTYQVTWQGCAKDRICYPPQTIEFQTDLDGLVNIQNTSQTKKTFLDVAQASQSSAANNITPEYRSDTNSPEKSADTKVSPFSTDTQVAQDQFWSSKLEQHSLGYGVLLFLGLGMLLAFTPCSLPMLPILTSLIVRDSKGLRAWMVALTFVCSMALVYAVLGLIASSAGLNFQRWLQQPATLVAFSLLFVVFALNLFGLFEIKLPQTLMNHLDRVQSVQRGGTLLGAAVMGMVSALLVGPCMTAPLAGTLLFISQTQDQWQGALLLFCLGFGMGIPLLLATILGAKVLPKAGQWMHQIKVIFAFIMLGLSLYFIRPLVSPLILQVLSLALGLSFIGYACYRLVKYHDRLRWLYVLLLIVVIPLVVFDQYQHIQRNQLDQQQGGNHWNVAHTASEFQQLLEQAPKDRMVIIDVYADWCVACQPIEHRVLKDIDVQKALEPFYLIKLDLSQYDHSHQVLLNQWQILGPPTYVFLDSKQQELRRLRLTGAFTKTELLDHLQSLKNFRE